MYLFSLPMVGKKNVPCELAIIVNIGLVAEKVSPFAESKPHPV